MTDTPPIRLLIVDDHPLVREGLKARLCTVPGLDVVGEAGDATEAFAQLAQTPVDLVLMDIGMKDVNGIDLTRLLLAQAPQLRVLVLSMYDNPEYVNRAMQAGARGYVLKDAPSSDIIEAIAAVQAGGTFLSAAISRAAAALADATAGDVAARERDPRLPGQGALQQADRPGPGPERAHRRIASPEHQAQAQPRRPGRADQVRGRALPGFRRGRRRGVNGDTSAGIA